MIVVDGNDVGPVSVCLDAGVRWLEPFYIISAMQGKGIRCCVLDLIVQEGLSPPPRLNVLQGSSARRFYDCRGFVVNSEDDIDVFMTFKPMID